MKRLRSAPWCALLAAACLALSGCRTLADRIVTPDGPDLLPANLAQIERHAGVRAARFAADDGVVLWYRELAPAQRGLEYTFERRADGMSLSLRFRDAGAAADSAQATVVLLHGWGADGGSMLPWGLALGERGYRTILVDLRGHGRSRPSSPGFGPREGADVAALVAALRASGGLQEPLYLMGVSHGAVAALHAAALLGEEVAGIVAISPYASARQGIHGVVESVRQMRGGGLRARAAGGWARWRYHEDRVDAAMRVAGRRLGLDLASIDTGPAVEALRACTLVLHGTDDGLFDLQDVEALARRSPLARFVALQDETHVTAPLRIDLLAAPLADWFAQVPRAPCPSFTAPAR